MDHATIELTRFALCHLGVRISPMHLLTDLLEQRPDYDAGEYLQINQSNEQNLRQDTHTMCHEECSRPCMVVRGCQWVGKPPISPTPFPGHRQVIGGVGQGHGQGQNHRQNRYLFPFPSLFPAIFCKIVNFFFPCLIFFHPNPPKL